MATPQGRSSVRVDVRTPLKRDFDMMRAWRGLSLRESLEEAMRLWVALQRAKRAGQMTPELRQLITLGRDPGCPGPGSIGRLS